jgi:hypothetical protein
MWIGAALDNKWVSRLGNLSFIVGGVLWGIREVSSFGATNAAIVALLLAGILLMAVPPLSRRINGPHAERRKAERFLALGRQQERASTADLDMRLDEITPISASFTLHPKAPSAPVVGGVVGNTRAIAREASELAKAAAAGSGLSPSAATVALHEVRTLRQQGQALLDELWKHADSAKQAGGALPEVYLGQAQDWHKRFRVRAERHLAAKELAIHTEAFPLWRETAPKLAGAGIRDTLVDQLDAMFNANLDALDLVEKRLSGVG